MRPLCKGKKITVKATWHENPSRWEDDPPGSDLKAEVTSVGCAVATYLAWLEGHRTPSLTAGPGNLYCGGRLVGRIAPNGGVWPPGKWTSSTRPLRKPMARDLAMSGSPRLLERCRRG